MERMTVGSFKNLAAHRTTRLHKAEKDNINAGHINVYVQMVQYKRWSF
jgi:hypothetical protein